MIRYLPNELLKKVAPKKKVERLVKGNLSLNRAALSTLTEAGVLSKKTLETVAIKVIKGYRRRYGDERKEGNSKKSSIEEAVNGKKELVARVQNTAVFEIGKEIKSQYRGEFYVWLPSDAEEPDPLHQLNYGKTFQIGKGEMPGDRYGCRCGMEIIVPEKRLKL